MPITTPTFVYPFDPSGNKESNRIVGEQHVFNGTVGLTYQKIVPRWAPFFTSVGEYEVWHYSPTNEKRLLVNGVDYYIGHRFLTATKATAKPIAGSINILDRSLQGSIVINYRTLGGDWTLDENAVAAIVADQLYNPRIISWEAVANPPYSFPVIDHEFDIVDMKGAEHLTEAIYRVVDAISQSSESGLVDHINDKENPHGVNKGHVGLGNVQNYSMATMQSAASGIATNEYMSPALTREAIRVQVLELLQSHMADTDNPHDNTPAKIGAVAESDFVTALAGKLGIDEAAADAQLFNGLTLAQLTAKILEGTAYNSQRLSGMTVQQLTDSILSGTAYNADRYNNMTFPEFEDWLKVFIGSLDDLQVVATDTERFNGKTYAEAKADILSGVASDSVRFSGMTLAEFTPYMKQVIEGFTELDVTVTNALKLNGLDFDQIRAAILEGTAADSERFAGMTVADYDQHILDIIRGLDEIPGTAQNSMRLEGRTLAEIKAELAQSGSGNASTLEGMTMAEIVALAQSGTSNDTEHFGGMTVDEFETSIIEAAVVELGVPTNWSRTVGTGITGVYNAHIAVARRAFNDTDTAEANARGPNRITVEIDNTDVDGAITGRARYQILLTGSKFLVSESFNDLGFSPEFKFAAMQDFYESRIPNTENFEKWQRVNVFVKTEGRLRVSATVYGGIMPGVTDEQLLPAFDDANIPAGITLVDGEILAAAGGGGGGDAETFDGMNPTEFTGFAISKSGSEYLQPVEFRNVLPTASRGPANVMVYLGTSFISRDVIDGYAANHELDIRAFREGKDPIRIRINTMSNIPIDAKPIHVSGEYGLVVSVTPFQSTESNPYRAVDANGNVWFPVDWYAEVPGDHADKILFSTEIRGGALVKPFPAGAVANMNTIAGTEHIVSHTTRNKVLPEASSHITTVLDASSGSALIDGSFDVYEVDVSVPVEIEVTPRVGLVNDFTTRITTVGLTMSSAASDVTFAPGILWERGTPPVFDFEIGERFVVTFILSAAGVKGFISGANFKA